MADFSVTPAELRVCALALGQVAGEARTAMGTVGAEVQALLSTGWRGPAAEGFAEGWRRWCSGAQDVVDGLDVMARLLEVTGQDYDAVDAAAQAMIAAPGRGLS